ncbi:hypothetical protein N7452_005423 [Penicillium brevicompactum]|uniref:Uncharacterized protein n=1 Tax=Penicillium brevicompactum TaxID=5074 RepID=A0A9W9QJV7_PENBR|nr:hypothetical protein N7452_005423 [Penicillium brevicompactum]
MQASSHTVSLKWGPSTLLIPNPAVQLRPLHQARACGLAGKAKKLSAPVRVVAVGTGLIASPLRGVFASAHVLPPPAHEWQPAPKLEGELVLLATARPRRTPAPHCLSCFARKLKWDGCGRDAFNLACVLSLAGRVCSCCDGPAVLDQNQLLGCGVRGQPASDPLCYDCLCQWAFASNSPLSVRLSCQLNVLREWTAQLRDYHFRLVESNSRRGDPSRETCEAWYDDFCEANGQKVNSCKPSPPPGIIHFTGEIALPSGRKFAREPLKRYGIVPKDCYYHFDIFSQLCFGLSGWPRTIFEYRTNLIVGRFKNVARLPCGPAPSLPHDPCAFDELWAYALRNMAALSLPPIVGPDWLCWRYYSSGAPAWWWERRLPGWAHCCSSGNVVNFFLSFCRALDFGDEREGTAGSGYSMSGDPPDFWCEDPSCSSCYNGLQRVFGTATGAYCYGDAGPATRLSLQWLRRGLLRLRRSLVYFDSSVRDRGLLELGYLATTRT